MFLWTNARLLVDPTDCTYTEGRVMLMNLIFGRVVLSRWWKLSEMRLNLTFSCPMFGASRCIVWKQPLWC